MTRSLLFVATVAGHTWGIARRPVRFLPELVGLGLIPWGVGMIYVPAGVIAAGLALIVVGVRIPRVPSRRPDAG